MTATVQTINKFKKYITALDEVYKLNAKTSVLDSDNSLVQAGANTNEIVIPKMDMDGLADYSRSNGYVKGAVTLTYETVAFNFDRGRKFAIDAMDNEETAGVAFGALAAEFMRTKTIPELDAFRFASFAGTSNILSATAATLADGNAVMAALIAAKTAQDEQEVFDYNRYLFITPTLHNSVMALDTTKSREALGYFAGIVDVPQTRFYTAIEQKDGSTSGEEAGGYAKASGGADINFMIVQKEAVMQYQKHVVSKVISADENQDSDSWAFMFRAYGLAKIYENKAKGVYLHAKAS